MHCACTVFCEYPMDQPLNQSPLIEEVSDKLVELITSNNY